MTIGIGCTGGQHRSIALGIKIGQILEQEGYQVNVKHRSISRSVSMGMPCLYPKVIILTDNASLLPKFAELCLQSSGKVNKIALVIDIRGDLFLDDLNHNLV